MSGVYILVGLSEFRPSNLGLHDYFHSPAQYVYHTRSKHHKGWYVQ